ncbi:PIR Superfamily Protein [Plasmodium ovale curtisi]|uniref:PIR Superfamily Protein n=1 Tax=Plasmodium ovale curtisi TaxID=864141 RepID=A0A1A8WUG2_PLAOA|nr:PIR Superfamily Protein [Plasmodium ovale curtisi]
MKLETIEHLQKRNIMKNVYPLYNEVKYVKVNKDVQAKLWHNIEDFWSELCKKSSDDFFCAKKLYVNTMLGTKKWMDLMVYCINRDELKSSCDKTAGIKEIHCLKYQHMNKLENDQKNIIQNNSISECETTAIQIYDFSESLIAPS